MEMNAFNLFEKLDAFSESYIQQIKKSIAEEIDCYSGEAMPAGSSKHDYYLSFIKAYDKHYTKLKQHTVRVVFDNGFHQLEYTVQQSPWEKAQEEVGKGIDKIKLDLITPTFELLGPEVIEASRSAKEMSNLMYRMNLPNDDLHQVAGRLAGWQVLDELQKKLTLDFSPCFADFAPPNPSGHPMENFYDQADKEKLRQAYEAIYQEKYGMAFQCGWVDIYEHTKQYLMAFVFALYRHPYGKIASYHRFLQEVCGYTFIPLVRTFQNWFSDYLKFVNERTKRAANHPKNELDKAYKAWKRKERKYLLLEELVEWIRERLRSYDIALA